MQQEKNFLWRKTRFQAYQRKGLCIVFLCLLLLSLSACGGDGTTQHQAQQDRIQLQQTLEHAQQIGVPQGSLKTILSQKYALDQTSTPYTFWSDQTVTSYFENLSIRYQQLSLQTQAIVQVTTEQDKGQAQTNLLSLQKALALGRSTQLPVEALSHLYDQQNGLFTKATTPSQFMAISKQAHEANTTLSRLPHTMDTLNTFGDVLTLLKGEHQDISASQQQYNDDKAAIGQAVTIQALENIEQQITGQNQQLAMQYQSLIPNLVTARITALSTDIKTMQSAGINVTTYQKELAADQTQGDQVKTMNDFLAFSKKIEADKASMQTDLLKGQTILLVAQFHKEVNDWGNAHLYHDIYDGNNYPLDNSYMAKGIGEDLDRDLSSAASVDDYQQLLTTTKNELFHLHMLEQDFTDKTPFDQAHQADIQLLQHYQLMQSQVIIVSTTEQALRLYQNGHLVKGFLVTAGRPELPTVPGLWRPLWRLTNTEFHSPYPKGSPYYYEPTKINYAIMYHDGGYFLHDSWWRNDYGPGTQFYHIDSSGNVSASYGTHGCVNIQEDQAAWLYNQTSYDTSIIIY